MRNDGKDDKQLLINRDKTIMPADIYRLLSENSGADDQEIKNFGEDIFGEIDEDKKCSGSNIQPDWTCMC